MKLGSMPFSLESGLFMNRVQLVVGELVATFWEGIWFCGCW